MITATNAIGTLSQIAKNKPEHRQEILESLVESRRANTTAKAAFLQSVVMWLLDM